MFIASLPRDPVIGFSRFLCQAYSHPLFSATRAPITTAALIFWTWGLEIPKAPTESPLFDVPPLPCLSTSKVAAPKGTATLVSRNFLDCLTPQEAPCHTKRTESRPKQHYRGAAVRNTMEHLGQRASTRKGRNFAQASPTAGIVTIPDKPPTYQTSEPALGPSYLANRYEYKVPSPRSILVPVPL